MDSTASYDVSSSAAEFLEKEKLCQELCQNISEGVVIEPNSISISTPRDLTRTPDEEISDLLKQMNQFLSPRERDVIRSSEEKSVENLLKEAEELIRSSTPLFLNMTFDSSEKSLKSPAKNNNSNNTNANNSNNNNNNNNTPNITTPKKTKSATPLVEEEETIVENQTEDVDDAANKNTEDDRNNNKSESLKNDRITKQNNNKNLKKDVERENNNKNLKKDVEVNNSNNKNDTDGIAKTNISHNNESSQLSTTTITSNSQQSNPLLEYNNQLFKEIGDKRKKRQIPVATSPFKKSTKEIQNTEKLTLSDLAIPIGSGHSVARMESNKRGSPAKSKGITPGTCCEEQKKKNVELEKIRKNYEERIFDLEQQINILNAKLKDYEYEALKVNANINESAKNQHQIELLETELRTQEQLIAGYQRENHKLCQEISACKVNT